MTQCPAPQGRMKRWLQLLRSMDNRPFLPPTAPGLRPPAACPAENAVGGGPISVSPFAHKLQLRPSSAILVEQGRTHQRRAVSIGKDSLQERSMKTSRHSIPLVFAVALALFAGALAQAASVTGTVTNKTTGKPSSGDQVVLVDVQAGMSEAATATTDSKGQYSLTVPPGGNAGAYLVRVTHQGASYFIAAPQTGTGGDLTVYDVSPKVDGVGIDADMLLFEGSAGELRISERYLVRNSSNPPKAQYGDKTFEIALPPDAQLDSASATRPGGLGTTTRLIPLSPKGHYTFNVPIQPDQGQKETLFEVQYHVNYNGKYTFKPTLLMPADNFVVYVPKSMTFSGASGADFQNAQDDPRVNTNIAHNVHPGQAIAFTVSEEGQMPRNQQQGMSPQAMMGGGGGGAATDTAATPSTPGGGIGNPIGTPDPLTRYKWWILGGLTLLLVIAAIY